MANLEIDAGNSRVKWRVLDAEADVVGRGQVAWSDFDVNGLLKTWEGYGVSRADVSCVASRERRELLLSVLHGYLPEDAVLQWDSAQGLGGLEYAYANINKLGLDRILAMVASSRLVSGGFLVVDAGSAMTADCVTASRQHLGGYIFPGLNLLRSSLLKGTSKVFASPEMLGQTSLGRDTEECVEHAITVMMSSTLTFLQDLMMRHELEVLVLTGGDASVIEGMISRDVIIQPDLVMDGLSVLRAGE